MNAFSATKILRVAEDVASDANYVAVLGRDIKTFPEEIARYCVGQHEAIYEDLAALVEGMAYWDRRILRTKDWPRELAVQIPVYELGQFQRTAIVETLTEAAHFLTGDRWCFDFVARKRPVPYRQRALSLPKTEMKHVVPFSDGLDSFAQVRLSVREHGRDAVMLVRSGLNRDRIFHNMVNLRVPRRFHGARLRELSYRTRPIVFYTYAAIGASIANASAVAIGENGQGAIGPACLPFGGEWWFRSAHPAFVTRWSKFLNLALGKSIEFLQPQLWKTKGEVLSEIRDAGLTAGWEQTNSCSTRPIGRYRRHGCGVCGGCLLRSVAAHAAGLPVGGNAFDVFASSDFAIHGDGRKSEMKSNERAVAVRSIATMAGFARLADVQSDVSRIQSEARLIDPAEPAAAEGKLRRLLYQHQSEWNAFMNSLPAKSWVREIVSQL